MASPFFYIQYADDVFVDPRTGRGITTTIAFDATTAVTRSANDKITTNIIETGAEVADHYILVGQTISFSGVISDIKSIRGANDKSTAEWLSALSRLRLSKQPFDVICGDIADVYNIGGAGNFNVIRDCLFSSFSATQTKQNGVTNQRVKSYQVSFTTKELRFGSRAEETEITVPADPIAKALAAPKKNGSATTTQVSKGGIIFKAPPLAPDDNPFPIT